MTMTYGRNGRSYGNFSGKIIVKSRFDELSAMTREELILALPTCERQAEVTVASCLLKGEDPKAYGIIVMDNPLSLSIVEMQTRKLDAIYTVERIP